jgi:hypothetical protein
MKLTSLRLNLETYGSDKGKYTGSITYEGVSGSVDLKLTPIISNALLATVAESILAASTQAAKELHDSIYQSIEEAKSPALTA